MMTESGPTRDDTVAALDEAKRRLATSSRELLEEHLRDVGQQRVDDELKALSDGGIALPTDEYRVVLRRSTRG